MKIVPVLQGSTEWLALRQTKITATDCAAILGKSKYKSPHMVWLDKMGKSKPFDNEAMRRGRELEPEARAHFNEQLGFNCQPVVVVSDENPWQMASLDGWDPEKQVIMEIKCPGESLFRDAEAGKFPEEYILQVLHQLAVCPDALYGCLCFYFKGPNGVSSVGTTVDRDEAEIIDLTAKEEAFYRSYVLQFVEPPLSKLDYKARDDAEWWGQCERWKHIKHRIEDLEDEEELTRQRLIELAGDQSCQGAGVRVTKYPQQGRVDYAKVPELQGVDLSPYRKPSTDQWRLTELKEGVL